MGELDSDDGGPGALAAIRPAALPDGGNGRAAGAARRVEDEEPALQGERSRRLLAVLFGSPEELTLARLAEILNWKRSQVRDQLAELGRWLDQLRLPFEVRQIAGGWKLVSRRRYAALLGRLRVVRRRDRLSHAALETLAIVAYKQPVMAVSVDRIRGIKSGNLLRQLVERDLVHVVGRQESPGRPLLYGTTRAFLDRFGLGRLEDLPAMDGLDLGTDPQAGCAEETAEEVAGDAAGPTCAEETGREEQASSPVDSPEVG